MIINFNKMKLKNKEMLDSQYFYNNSRRKKIKED